MTEDFLQFFVDWTKRKIRHHIDEIPREFYFREKEIWWSALGQNIGYEMNGKHELFERPVLVIRKYSEDMCFVLPLTTKIKEPLPWYQIILTVEGEEEKSAVNISQGKTISAKRLLRKITVAGSVEYNTIISNFKKQFEEIQI